MLDLPTHAIYTPNDDCDVLPADDTITWFNSHPKTLTPGSKIAIHTDTQTIKDDESKTPGSLTLPNGNRLTVNFSFVPYIDSYGLDRIRKRSQDITKFNSEQSRVRVIGALGMVGSDIVVWNPTPDSASYYDSFNIARSKKANDEEAEEYLKGLLEITKVLGYRGLICATFDPKNIRNHEGTLIVDDQRSVRSLEEGDVVYRTMETYYRDLAKQGITGRQFRDLFVRPLSEIASKQKESLLYKKGMGAIVSFFSGL